MLRMVFGPHIPVLGRGLGELPNKRKGVAFWPGERSENEQKDIPFHCLQNLFRLGDNKFYQNVPITNQL